MTSNYSLHSAVSPTDRPSQSPTNPLTGPINRPTGPTDRPVRTTNRPTNPKVAQTCEYVHPKQNCSGKSILTSKTVYLLKKSTKNCEKQIYSSNFFPNNLFRISFFRNLFSMLSLDFFKKNRRRRHVVMWSSSSSSLSFACRNLRNLRLRNLRNLRMYPSCIGRSTLWSNSQSLL